MGVQILVRDNSINDKELMKKMIQEVEVNSA